MKETNKEESACPRVKRFGRCWVLGCGSCDTTVRELFKKKPSPDPNMSAIKENQESMNHQPIFQSNSSPDFTGLDRSFRHRFRALLMELDDMNMHMHNVHEPTKGTIYFDGIEVEKFIENFLHSAIVEERAKAVAEERERAVKEFQRQSNGNDIWNAAMFKAIKIIKNER